VTIGKQQCLRILSAQMSFSELLPKPSIILSIIERRRARSAFRAIYRKYRAFTMIYETMYVDNLELCARFAATPGCVVECGVWRGGMSAGMAEVLGTDRQYFLFDSFEGLPPAREELDGASAVMWQGNTNSPTYYNNCAAAQEEAAAAMKLSGATSFSLVKGWFNETLPRFVPPCEIAVLRLDGDWYDSTRVCLESLYPHVAPGGIVVFDDYYVWDGCARAVNEFLAGLASPNSVPRLWQFRDRTAYLMKPATALPPANGSSRQHQ
jgi:O-methyltransferase